MDLSQYDEKHVQVKSIYGDTFTGVADYFSFDYCRDEFGVEEDAVIINGFRIHESQIASIEEIEVHGTAELRTRWLKLRRYRPEDANDLYKFFGKDPEMYRYSGWNPYATPEMAEEMVRRFIDSYQDEHSYSWVMEFEDILVGTIGAYDHHDDCIEVGLSVARDWWGCGYATEALKAVLPYLTENEGIARVTAWCAADNVGSRKALEKAGMKLIDTRKNGLVVGGETYDQLIFEYRAK